MQSQVSELLEHKMRERVSDGIMVAWDVSGAEDILVSDGVPHERRMNGVIEKELERPWLMISTTEIIIVYKNGLTRLFVCP